MTTKDELRTRLKERRKGISPAQKKELDGAIVRHVLASEAYRNADLLLLYAPLSGEVDLLPLARQARRDGKAIAFPRCDTQSTRMQFYLLTPEARLLPGAYGIPEPPRDAPPCLPTERSLCLLPALSFDPQGNRMGYGKGYYDRFLLDFPGVRAGVVHRRMMVKALPVEPHDLPVSLLFTEAGERKCPARDADDANALPSAPTVREEADESTAADENASRASRSRLPEGLRLFFEGCRRAWQKKDGVYPLHAPPLLVLGIFVLLLLSRLIDTQLTTRENEYAVVILLQLLIFVLPTVLYCKLRSKSLLERLRVRPVRPEQLWFLLCILIVMITGGMLLSILTGGIRSLSGSFTLYATFVAHADGNTLQILYVILSYGLLPAVCEELVFRAVLCAEYERFGVPVAVILSSLFFAFLHFSLPLFPTYLFLGVLLAAALYTTRSLLSALLLHLLYNLFCIFGQPYLSAFYVYAGSNEIFLFCLVTLFLLFSAFAVGEARKIYHRYANANLPSPQKADAPLRELPVRVAKAVFTPTAIPCALIWLVMAILNLVL